MANAQLSNGKSATLPWLDDQLERVRRFLRAEKKAENTVMRYGNMIRDFLVWYGREPGTLTKADMQRYKEYLAESEYSQNSMRTMIAAVNQYALRIIERPDLCMRAPKRLDKAVNPLTVAEIEKILLTARESSLRDHAAICLMYYGAMRVHEASNMRISDIDFDTFHATIRKGKGGSDRQVNLSEYAVTWIREYIQKERREPLNPEDSDRLFLSVNGRELPRNQLWRVVKEIAFVSGIQKRVYPHLFRHSLATHMAEKGIPATKIQQQTGHKSLDMLQRYIHLSEKAVRESYDEGVTANPDRMPIVSENKAQRPVIAPKDGMVNYVYSFSLGAI